MIEVMSTITFAEEKMWLVIGNSEFPIPNSLRRSPSDNS
jgi:hypothetical protein